MASRRLRLHSARSRKRRKGRSVFLKLGDTVDTVLALVGHHADAVALPQTAEKVLLGPGIFKALLLGLQNFGHVAPDHPTNVDANLLLLGPTRVHEGLPPLRTAREAPSVGAPRLRS